MNETYALAVITQYSCAADPSTSEAYQRVRTRAALGPGEHPSPAVRLWVMCESAHHAGLRRTRPMHMLSSLRHSPAADRGIPEAL
eukprot:10601968-Alexandrium_andersonii.AAC.1